VLVDKNRNIRGYYHGLDTNALSRLSEDIILLTLERDPKQRSFLAGKLELIAVVFVVAAIGIVVLMKALKRENKKA
jgi:protein SCO1/2